MTTQIALLRAVNLGGRTKVGMAELRKQLDDFFARYTDPKYDLWRGGQSKASRLSQRKKSS